MDAPKNLNENATAALTSEQQKEKAVKAYHDAATRADKAQVVKQYPELKNIFSDANHS
jgi:hypothetical protein